MPDSNNPRTYGEQVEWVANFFIEELRKEVDKLRLCDEQAFTSDWLNSSSTANGGGLVFE